jgi:hypothetical protein
MPRPPESPERHSAKLLPALLWAGVGLAPIAVLALVLGNGERSLRIAIALALLAVVLIGLSVVLRPSVESVKVDLQDALYDEIDVVREGMRNDVAAAARATHRSIGERFEHLQAAFEHLRGQLDATRSELARQGGGTTPAMTGPPRATASVPAGVVRHTETVQVTTRSTIVDPQAAEPRPAEPRPAETHRGASWPGDNPPAAANWPGDNPPAAANWPGDNPPAAANWPGDNPPAAQQAVGRSPAWASGGVSPAQSPNRHEDSQPGRRPEPAPPSYEDSWTEQQLRRRFAEADVARTHNPQPEDTERWSGMQSGDRWASVRADEHGRELRMGERRTSMHADQSGAEFRVEDRWAALRRESPEDQRWAPEPGRALPAGRDADNRRTDHWDRRDGWRDAAPGNGGPGREAWEQRQGWEQRDDQNPRGGRRRRDWDDRDWDNQDRGRENRPRALPATSDEQSAVEWLSQLAPPPQQQQERRHRYADDY